MPRAGAELAGDHALLQQALPRHLQISDRAYRRCTNPRTPPHPAGPTTKDRTPTASSVVMRCPSRLSFCSLGGTVSPVQRPCRRPGSDSYPCPLRGTWWQGSRRFGRRGQTRRLVTVATGGRRLAHSIRFSTWRSSTKTDSGLHHPAAVRFRSLAPCVRQPYGWQEAGLLSPLPQLMTSR
jgi:hypothetical protein